jgi:UDP-N-acetylglucosamine 2-epimerase (non-hydrolysing)
MKKILVSVGTRPNLIKITQLEKAFQAAGDFEFRLLHTGQHYDYTMNEVFFEELEIRKPDYYLEVKGDNQLDVIAEILKKVQEPLLSYQPDIVLVPGDVNSTFAVAFAAQRLGFKVGHIESGLRSYDREMPEEINRMLTDQISDFYFISEEDAIDNLLKEGIPFEKLHFVGNTMIDTLVAFMDKINTRIILETHQLEPQNYAVVTFHRPGNVDNVDSLRVILESIRQIAEQIPVVFPIHPRTRKNIEAFGLSDLLPKNNLVFTEPLGYLDFMKLIKESLFVLTDSGGVQEETSYLQVPCLTVRPSTERPVTITDGTNMLLALDKNIIVKECQNILNGNFKDGNIPDLWDGQASERIVEIIRELL